MNIVPQGHRRYKCVFVLLFSVQRFRGIIGIEASERGGGGVAATRKVNDTFKSYNTRGHSSVKQSSQLEKMYSLVRKQ